MDLSDALRTRSICLKKTPEGQALKACALLNKLEGVSAVSPINKHRLSLSYSLNTLTFELIEGLLKELGIQLDPSIPAMIRRYYYQYAEDNVREKLNLNRQEQSLVCRLNPDSNNLKHYWDEYH